MANANLALVKYWGKAGGNVNDAAGGSLSLTLEGLSSLAGARVRGTGKGDYCRWNPPAPAAGLTQFVAQARERLGIGDGLDIVVTSNFPAGSGLASSASAYSAVTTLLAGLADPQPRDAERAELARSGSGSACRSLLGGFVEWRPGKGGSVTQIATPEHWPVDVVIAVVREGPKDVSSREGMLRTAATSPFYEAWLAAGAEDLPVVRGAILNKDIQVLGPAIERNALRMHATALGADPPLLYWEPATLAVVREVWKLRKTGVPAYFSIDAGPQVKVICEPGSAERVAPAIAAVPGVIRVLRSFPGRAPSIVTAPPSWAQLPPDWSGSVPSTVGRGYG
ncbi:diphosphomevalonate decarboxylase [Streptomyces sp. IBSNAI002]|uniref:diphosphomevalonate decarboxylase n=1 Tax=Streptomyces sp. IBSNAI002 TaxID=3457500 RepID=UPI003FD26EE0